MRVPFVGCKSGGQTGPLDAPQVAEVDVRLDAQAAARVALYMPENGPAILGPRDWSCFGAYGSSGTTVIVAPTLREARVDGITGFGIQASEIEGDTSGRFTVAHLVARVFPTQKSFVENDLAPIILRQFEAGT